MCVCACVCVCLYVYVYTTYGNHVTKILDTPPSNNTNTPSPTQHPLRRAAGHHTAKRLF